MSHDPLQALLDGLERCADQPVAVMLSSLHQLGVQELRARFSGGHDQGCFLDPEIMLQDGSGPWRIDGSKCPEFCVRFYDLIYQLYREFSGPLTLSGEIVCDVAQQRVRVLEDSASGTRVVWSWSVADGQT